MNINVTPELERNLRRLMKARGIRHKSEAIRIAVREAAERIAAETPPPDVRSWIGMGVGPPENPAPRFRSDDDLWERG